MFRFIENAFFTSMALGCILLNVIPLKCASMGSQACKIRL